MQLDLTLAVSDQDMASARLERLRAAARTRLHSYIDEVTLGITGPVPADEKLSWGTKDAAARAVLEATATPAQTALLAGEAAMTGETISDLATRIVGLGDSYRQAIAVLTGIRRKAQQAIDAATSAEDLNTAVEAAMTDVSTHLSQGV